MLTRDDYADWWQEHTDDEGELITLPEPIATLAAHVQALQGRIDKLPDPEAAQPDSWQTQCCCAYDDPRDVCVVHNARPAGMTGAEDAPPGGLRSTLAAEQHSAQGVGRQRA